MNDNLLKSGFDWEGSYPWGYDELKNPSITLDNIEDRAFEFVYILRERANFFKTGKLLFPMGCDFEYRTAGLNFGNMSLLMGNNLLKIFNNKDYINSNYEKYRIQIQYSLLSEYFESVHNETEFPIFTKDFMPYADNELSYWTVCKIIQH